MGNLALDRSQLWGFSVKPPESQESSSEGKMQKGLFLLPRDFGQVKAKTSWDLSFVTCSFRGTWMPPPWSPFSSVCVCAWVTVCVSACLVCVYFSFCLNFVQNKRPFNFSNLAYSTPTPQRKIVEGVRSTRAAGAGAAGGKVACASCPSALILTFSCSGFPESPRQTGLMPFLRGQRHLADETSNP